MAYVILGATGQTGGATAEALIERATVRAVVRSEEKGEAWKQRGAQIAIVEDVTDAGALARAFEGADGAFVLNPPDYASDDMFARAEAVAASLCAAARASGLPRMVALSSVGAHLPRGTGNIVTAHILEQKLREIEGTAAVGFMRAAGFMENWRGLLPVAQAQGVLPSFYSPLDRALPAVSTADIGRACADALLQSWQGTHVWELSGPRPVSPNDVASAFSQALGREVRAEELPEAAWPEVLSRMGNSPSAARSYTEMMRAFNDGTLVFEERHATAIQGQTSIEEAVASWARLVTPSAPHPVAASQRTHSAKE